MGVMGFFFGNFPDQFYFLCFWQTPHDFCLCFQVMSEPNQQENSELMGMLDTNERSRLLTCVALSRAVYASSADQMIKMLNDELKPYNHGLTELVLSQNCQQQYAIGLKYETKEMFVAFRGTSNMQDVFVDLRILGLPSSPYGCFHDGFSSRASLIPVAPFANFLEQQSGWKLVVTGHSLGGAVATIVATTFLGDPRIRENAEVFCVTFGAPLCCDENAVQFFEERYAEHFSHYINDKDIVPRLLSITETVRARLFASKKTENEALAQQLGQLACKELGTIFSSKSKSKSFGWPSWFSSPSAVLQFIAAKTTGEAVGNLLIPRFTPMGKVYSLSIHAQTVGAGDHCVTEYNHRATKLDKKQIELAYTLDLNVKGVLTAMQDHLPERYGQELWDRLREGVKPSTRATAMIASPSSLLARYFFLSAPCLINQSQESEERKGEGVPLYWSIVRTPLQSTEEVCLEIHTNPSC